MATIEVDGKTLEVEAGEMLIKATDKAGIYIPRFCYHDKLSVAANCRMCLVEVEKAPKPLPACATPIMDGMKVFTKSKLAREAQKGTMEFLLINHPLDCPVCDQGGECPLQDQALGYGKDESRFLERKRVVASHDIGPLVATEMTRCIHCTRCVRYGEEVAGIMEMGAPGRGEYTQIGTFLNQSVDSEVSGNMIDLCPVGALTSKPYRFAARSWELQSHASISPHDCVGTNINVQTLRDQVERVLPIENTEVNDCWIADRDRYSYEAVNSDQRLTVPMIRDGNPENDGGWREVNWESALKYAAAGLLTVIESSSGNHVGGLASASSTLEEFHLFQKLLQAMGSSNIDHRLQQLDFRDDSTASRFPISQLPIADFSNLDAGLLIGSNIRKEQPLLSLRLREATLKNQAQINVIGVMDYEMNFDLAQNIVSNPASLVNEIALLAVEVSKLKENDVPEQIALLASPNEQYNDTQHLAAISNIANQLCSKEQTMVTLGAIAQQHKDASVIRFIAQWICDITDARMVILPPANSVAGWVANCTPGEAGKNTVDMLAAKLKAYVLLGCEPELDHIDGQSAMNAMLAADFVLQISAFKSSNVMKYADVILPMAAFTEAAGTYVNCEGRVQKSSVAAPPKEESRPAWKILRVLGNFMEFSGFDQITLDDVTSEVSFENLSSPKGKTQENSDTTIHYHHTRGLQRISDTPMYRAEATLRNAKALQKTADNPPPAAGLNAKMMEKYGFSDSDLTLVVTTNGEGNTVLPIRLDNRVPNDCVYISAGHLETAPLGADTSVSLEKA
ncbi:MAG: NADH-quinone oxidoreductase subunit G [Gammaproteobacteria bacterium]|nr:NADH-quinone oxidoreductase subunit G [Gammaproteobacteria bacterium]